MMNLREPVVAEQITELNRLQTCCLESRQALQQLRDELSRLSEREAEETARLKSLYAARLREQLESAHADARNRMEQAEIDNTQQTKAARDAHDRRLEELNARHQEEVHEIRQNLQNELWVLQSVCDESHEDSPVRQAERSHEVFQTHRNHLDQQLSDLDQRVELTSRFLRICHAGSDSALPPASVQPRGRDASRTLAVEQVDLGLIAAGLIDRQNLPQWILGWRIYGLGLVIFGVIVLVSTGIRADLRLFLNPEFSKPDWEWLGVSCLIGFGAVILILTVLLVVVQSNLRSRFEEVLQHAANAKAAADYWKQKSRVELKRVDAAADAWKAEMLQRREQHAARLQGSAEDRIESLTCAFREETAKHGTLSEKKLASIQADFDRQQSALEHWQAQEAARVRQQLLEESETEQTRLHQSAASARAELEDKAAAVLQRWMADVVSARELVRLSRDCSAAFPRWSHMCMTGWTPPEKLPAELPAGELLASVPLAPAEPSGDLNLMLTLDLTALLSFPHDMSIVIEHDAAGREPALEFVRAILLRLLTSIMPGRVQFTLIDPVGLGQSFSAMMHLADFDELMISNRIWTESIQIRDRLQKVTEHMERIFQTYLRSEFETIEDYNAAAGEVAEPYHFVVVAGFPASFTEEAARHLTSILTSGPRCGVHAIMTWSPEMPLPRSFDTDHLRTCCTPFHVSGGRVQPGPRASSVEPAKPAAGTRVPGRSALSVEQAQLPKQELPQGHPEFAAAAPPESADYISLVRAVGERSRNARRVEVSFSRIAPKPEAVWTHSSAEGIDFPIGRAGAARLQYLRLGRGTSQHVLVAGKTGSGKSTLLHILITNLALHYSPAEIQFFLIDFKKGVEFRTYAANQLPHARVVAIESDREFGLSVLERLDEILQERGELFRVRGVQDVPSFRRQFPQERMPRLLLLIDEFQEFFTTEDRVSSRASLLLDRLIRQGRAFGIHVLLGSQTLGGAYSLARSTLGQVAVRIALQCSESDAHLILSEENSAARLLTRPGEAIYNDANGLVEGNHPFQIAWLDEAQRETMILAMVRRPDYHDKADGRMIVFEGNVAPTPEHCGPLNAWLSSEPDATRHFVDSVPAWLGEPVAIAAPMCVEFRRSGGQNMLIVGQESDLADSLLASTIVSWCTAQASQGRPRSSQMILVHDGRDRGSLSRFRDTFAADIAPRLSLREPDDADTVVEDLWEQMQQRESGTAPADAPEVMLAVRNIGQFRSLRREEDDFGMAGFGTPKQATPASQFADLIRKGPLVGIHVMIWSDTFGNAMRWLSTSLLREFDNRIAFRLNQTDSSSLIDTPAAASLTQGRAILYRDQTGTADRFRPFSWPSATWLAALAFSASPDAESPAPLDDFDINELLIE